MGHDKIKKILIAGGAGFLGARLANRLIAAGFKVAVLDNLWHGDKSRLDKKVKFYFGDVADRRMVAKIFKKEKPDVVVNLAARVYWREEDKDPAADVATSVLGTINLLENCLKFGAKKFVFASTISVYGRSLNRIGIKENAVINLSDLPQSIFSYAAAKYAAEEYIVYFQRKFGLPDVILRFGHFYGPGQAKQRDVLSFFAEAAAAGRALTLSGNGQQFRDFIYIDDAASAAALAVVRPVRGIFNVGGGRAVSIRELAEVFKKAAGKNLTMKKIKNGEPAHGRWMNIARAKRILRWSPKTDLLTGLKNTYQDYLKNRLK